MNETISSILAAEKVADEMIAAANEKAKQSVYDAEAEADKIRKAALEFCKEQKIANVKTIAKKAEEAYAATVKTGEAEAAELKKSVEGKIDAAAEKVVKGIIG